MVAIGWVMIVLYFGAFNGFGRELYASLGPEIFNLSSACLYFNGEP